MVILVAEVVVEAVSHVLNSTKVQPGHPLTHSPIHFHKHFHAGTHANAQLLMQVAGITIFRTTLCLILSANAVSLTVNIRCQRRESL